MSLIKLTSGGSDLEPGTYPVMVTAITPKVVPYNGEDNDVLEWKFELVDTGEEITGLTSRNTGTRSKIAQFITALLGPEAAAVGAEFSEADLIGKGALASVILNAKGWPKVDALMPMPRTRTRPAPVDSRPVAAAATVRAQAAPAGDDDLPF